ncbi:phosphotransferase [Nocardioides rubriscoriae]|uniref:phosphotransferase n=1 Tax=Nocardioides rubriscoriae TaxID=642762 RepID=UPI0011DFA977|nr:phosphotransferase [Nocardioides rubriscoriae]
MPLDDRTDAETAAVYSPSWVDLLGLAAGDRVRLVGDDRVAEAAVRHRGGVLDDGAAGGLHDVVCLQDIAFDAAALRRHAATLAPGGRLVLVVDNAASPLRLADRLAGRPGGRHAVVGLGRVRRRLRSAGLEVDQVFGLLRSSAAPVTAFDLAAPEAVRSVLGATLSHVGGTRGTLVSLLTRSPVGALAPLCPAWLVVARPRGSSVTPADDRIVGKISNRDSKEVKLVCGSPPRVLEKHYLTGSGTTEVEALRELDRIGFTLAPRIVGEPAPSVCRMTWLPGRPLLPAALDADEVVVWVDRALAVLADLHARSRQPDGSVLVHGDFWLGNLLVDDEQVVGVVDWTGVVHGPDHVDRDFLVESTVALRPDLPGLRARLATTAPA